MVLLIAQEATKAVLDAIVAGLRLGVADLVLHGWSWTASQQSWYPVKPEQLGPLTRPEPLSSSLAETVMFWVLLSTTWWGSRRSVPRGPVDLTCPVVAPTRYRRCRAYRSSCGCRWC